MCIVFIFHFSLYKSNKKMSDINEALGIESEPSSAEIANEKITNTNGKIILAVIFYQHAIPGNCGCSAGFGVSASRYLLYRGIV
jgi:hypothetical protein